MSNTPNEPWRSAPPPQMPPPATPPPQRRPWYRKKRWIAVMAFVVLVVLAGLGDDTPETAGAAAAALTSEPAEPEPEPKVVADEPEPEPEPTPSKTPKPKPTPKPKFHEADYEDLTAREFSKITRDPDAHVGEKVLVFGEVFQFDSLTGTDQFLAYVDGDRDTEGEEFGFVSYDHTALLGEGEFKRATFDDVVEDDHFAAWVTVLGSFDYDTQIGGSTTATALFVDRIKVLPPVE